MANEEKSRQTEYVVLRLDGGAWREHMRVHAWSQQGAMSKATENVENAHEHWFHAVAVRHWGDPMKPDVTTVRKVTVVTGNDSDLLHSSQRSLSLASE